MRYSFSYTLDKPFYRECFQSCAPLTPKKMPRYALLLLLVGLGMFSIYGLKDHYLGTFLIMLAILECVANYFQEPWWVTRQMWSRAAGTDVQVIIDEQGIKTENRGNKMQWLWADITAVVRTNSGVVFSSARGNHYLSASHMEEQVIDYIINKAKK
ncbi:YcxB family protein [Pseudoalteromonas fenneropenaei]|uniref:YcxB family protein n=1 Tax=Pseudoalteromonas fenneropenaei TaxID=1737459 RepID=A0ABV7CCG9_9GAMM